MIHAEMGKTQIKGSIPVIQVELEEVLREFRKVLEKECGKETALEMIDEVVENSKHTLEERNEGCEKFIKEKELDSDFKAFLKFMRDMTGEMLEELEDE